jgi:apolipoprotein N-acyltransferase
MNALARIGSKTIAVMAVWFVVFLILLLGGLKFNAAEDSRWTTLGGSLLAVAAVLTVLIYSLRVAGADGPSFHGDDGK